MWTLSRAEQLLQLRRYAEALALLYPLATRQDAGDVWCSVALAELRLGRLEKAMAAAARAAAVAPDTEWPHRLVSVVAQAMGDGVKAETAAREAIRVSPGAWQTHAALSRALHLRRHGGKAAVAAARESVALGPFESEAHLLLGTMLLERGKRREAQEPLREALRLEPGNSAAHNELARTKMRKGMGARALSEAASGFADAARTDPDSAAARRNIDLVLAVFFRQTAMLVLLDAWVIASFGRYFLPEFWARAVSVLALSVPLVMAGWFLRRLPRDLRRYAGDTLRRPAMRVAAAAVVLAALCLVVSSVLPSKTALSSTSDAHNLDAHEWLRSMATLLTLGVVLTGRRVRAAGGWRSRRPVIHLRGRRRR